MKITFIGGMPGGTLRDPRTGREYEFKRGEAIDVPDELGKEVTQTEIWKESEA